MDNKAWNAYSHPPHLQRVVKCNDCGFKAVNLQFEQNGDKCPHCKKEGN
jgi:predicted Zn-ribbon and HTH transcriptional regulator